MHPGLFCLNADSTGVFCLLSYCAILEYIAVSWFLLSTQSSWPAADSITCYQFLLAASQSLILLMQAKQMKYLYYMNGVDLEILL